MNVELLTESQREILPEVILRRNRFKSLVLNCIKKKDETFSNAIIISGKPGSGKTTLITEFLEELESEQIIDKYKRIAGHTTKSSFIDYLMPELVEGSNDEYLRTVHLIDDCDAINDNGCLELMKAAFDTRSNHKTNRVVFYHAGLKKTVFKYRDFAIIITNNEFSNPGERQQALLDRVHLFSIDMNLNDFIIYNTYIIENYLNENPDCLSSNVIELTADFFNTHVKKWFSCNAFGESKVGFSIRLIRKFIDLMILFGEDWQEYSIEFKKLEAYSNAFNKNV